MIANVPMIDVGIASEDTIVAVKFLRKKKTIMIARIDP